MAYAGAANLDTGALMEQRGRCSPAAVKINQRTPLWWLHHLHLQSSALAAPWAVRTSPRHLPPSLQVLALILTTPLLLLLSRFILFFGITGAQCRE
jgi:hypothetical protein